ncbi:MAG: hypothetical protein ABIY62_01275, partial [Ginsengibacter sp.]
TKIKRLTLFRFFSKQAAVLSFLPMQVFHPSLKNPYQLTVRAAAWSLTNSENNFRQVALSSRR